MTAVDIIVIGSGPAGMAAALTATQYGAEVTVIDEQYNAGGQIYRNLENTDKERAAILGKDYTRGKSLLTQFNDSKINRIHDATVWSVTRDGTVTYSRHSSAKTINAAIIIIATGALERPYPIPGWTLPGVMTAGAAQILLKSNGIIADHAVLAGTGPLLYAVANQLLAAGASIAAIVDTVSASHYRRAAVHFPIASVSTIAAGLSYLRNIKKSGVPYYRGCSSLAVFGNGKAKGLSFHVNGREEKIHTEHVLLHQGVVPNVQLSHSLRLDHRWHEVQCCFHPVVDEWGTTSEPTIRIAGDGSGIGGAVNAEHQGKVAAIGALTTLGRVSHSKRAAAAAESLHFINRNKRLRYFLDLLYAPPRECSQPADSTVICRCEEVTAGEIRTVARLGCIGPNQAKSFCRCGMGPCQGRYCGNTVTQLLAATHGLPHDEVGYYRIRSPIKPVTLQELASLS